MSLLPRCTCEPHEAMVGRYDEDCARHASVREWLKNRRTPMDRPDSRFTHEWHVAINQHCSPLMGSGEWPKWMYEAKAMADEVPRMVMLFRREREKALPATHKQCSMTPAVPVKDNHLSCCLGVKCRECPELLALEKMKRSPEDIDTAKAWTCASHIASKGGDFMNEGYLLTVDDSMYWDNVHASLAQGDEGDAP